MRNTFSFYLLLVITAYCLMSCEPDDDINSSDYPQQTIVYDCCDEHGQLPSEPGEGEEEDDEEEQEP